MFQVNIECYLWDLLDEQIDEVLDRLQGEVGVTGINVAACCGRIRQLRPHRGVSPKRFISAGGVQFQPETANYAGTRIRPVVADWLGKRNPLAKVAEGCGKRGLKLRAWIVGCDSPVTIKRYPIAAVKDVLGEPSASRICPVNPDVREYLRAIVEDLTGHYPVDTIEIKDLSFPTDCSIDPCEQTGFDPGPLGSWLRRQCFCESCQQLGRRDGVDVEAAARSVTVVLEKLFEDGRPTDQSVGDFIADNPAIKAYTDWQAAQVASLLQAIRQSCRCPLTVEHADNPAQSAEQAKALADCCDNLAFDCHDLQIQAVQAEVDRAKLITGDVGRVELGISAAHPACENSETLVAAVGQAAKLGVKTVNIANYGLLPADRLAWVQKATRYAKRLAD